MKPSPTPTVLGKMVGTKALALMLGVSERWVRLQAERGSLPHYRHGCILRFNPAEILALMRCGTVISAKTVMLQPPVGVMATNA